MQIKIFRIPLWLNFDSLQNKQLRELKGTLECMQTGLLYMVDTQIYYEKHF